MQEYRAEGEQHTRWTVFNPQGRVLARATGPDGFTVHDIGRDHVLGLRADELDVERIVVYRLLKGR